MHGKSARRAVGMVLRVGQSATLSDAQLLDVFIRNREAEAFAEIVRRHGAMVFGVCRRILAHEQDAEDAFQATFLVLARKPSAIKPLEALGRWLYGVAFRCAQKAKSRRRREAELRAQAPAHLQTAASLPREIPDWLPLLDQELNRLSERERLPIVLCDLMGRSRKEAAEELGLSEGTLSSRLARGRVRLRGLLERRGVVPAITAAGVVSESFAVPAMYVDSAVSLTAVAATSAKSKLAEGVIRTMVLKSIVKPMVLASILLIAGAGLLWSFSPGSWEAKRNMPAAEGRGAKGTTNESDEAAKIKKVKEKDEDGPKNANANLKNIEARDKRVRFLVSSLENPISEIEKGEIALPFFIQTLGALAGPEGEKDPSKRVEILLNEEGFKKHEKEFDAEIVQIKIPSKLVNVRFETVLGIIGRQLDGVAMVRHDCIEFVPRRMAEMELGLRLALDEPMPVLINQFFTKVPLEKALEQLAERYEQNIILSQAAGQKSATPITARFVNAPLGDAVEILANMADLKLVRRSNIIYVTTREQADALTPACRTNPEGGASKSSRGTEPKTKQ